MTTYQVTYYTYGDSRETVQVEAASPAAAAAAVLADEQRYMCCQILSVEVAA